MSDLHLEGQKFKYEPQGEDVLFLAGDIYTRNRLHLFLDTLPPDLPVYFVHGNHELYHGVFEDVVEYHKDLENRYNFTFLNNQHVEIDGVPVFGGAMFTDFELYGITESWFAKQLATTSINDFRTIHKRDGSVWTYVDHLHQFELFMKAFQEFMFISEGAEKRFVMTHFMCTNRCTPPQFKNHMLNPYFTANMERYMGWDGVWACGHGHNSTDFMVGDTRVVMNPRGYSTEHSTFNPDLIIEI